MSLAKAIRTTHILLILTTALPVFAQMDLSGSWSPRNYGDALGNRPGPGPNPVDYLGIPLNDFARARALIYRPDVCPLHSRLPHAGALRPENLQ
jgi:hypothetical protein